MPRGRKKKELGVIEEPKVVAEAPKKNEPIRIVCAYKHLDEDGNKWMKEAVAEGASLEEALKDADFPLGKGILQSITAIHGDYKVGPVRVANHKAYRMFVAKSVPDFYRVFGKEGW